VLSLFVAGLYAGSTFAQKAQKVNQARTWGVYKADAASSSSSPLTQINKDNVSQLKVAWSFTPTAAAPPAGGRGGGNGGGECNPIVIDGVMYTVDQKNKVYAINAGTGKQIWAFDPSGTGVGIGGIKRGVAYWEKGKDKRILYTAGDNMYAINAETGNLITTFGNGGKISMNTDMRDDPKKISVIPTSPGIIYKDLIIIGTEVAEVYDAVPGYERAFNVKTGKLVWTFHTIPHPGEFGYETWGKDSWRYEGGANDWGGMSLDEKRGIVFLATGAPANDYYGANRVGNNLFGNSVIALNAKTGKYIWHFQTIHHDLWDYDLPAPPNLITIVQNGKKIDAVAQTSKVGFVYILDRATGKPIFPIEERPVPKSDIPGEYASPTQPFPTKPKPYARQNISIDSLNYDGATTQAIKDTMIKRFKELRYDGLFTPPSVRGTIEMPGSVGGMEWGGAAFDPYKGVLFIKSNDTPETEVMRKIEPGPQMSVFNAGRQLYINYCLRCHGADRKGDESQDYPTLLDIKSKMTKDELIKKINTGGGKMKAYADVIKGQEDAIYSFLFDIQNAETTAAGGGGGGGGGRRATVNANPILDSIVRYQNITAYRRFSITIPPAPGAAPAAGGGGGGGGGARGGNSIQAIKGPWATLNAINMNTGDYEWRIPYDGGSVGPTVTAGGVLFAPGTNLRAFDKDTGKLLWESAVPIRATGNVSTFMVGTKQYIAVAVSGTPDAPGASYVAFALPDK